MSTYEATVSMLRELPESDLLKVKAYISSFFVPSNTQSESVKDNPFRPLSEDEIYEQLSQARAHVEEGRVKPAMQASANVRAKHGL